MECTSGCTCDPVMINAHHDERNSQLHSATLFVTPSQRCTITATLRHDTASSGFKFKVGGVIVSDEAGRDTMWEGLGDWKDKLPISLDGGSMKFVEDNG